MARKKKNEEEDRVRRMHDARDENPDLITGEPGSHPVGVAAGGSGGAVAGATVGAAVGGPVGAAVGGAVGAVAGGAAGKAAAEALNPTLEDEYWQKNYRSRPYYRQGMDYASYAPAYRYGWESASREDYQNREFEDVEPHLQKEWETDKTKYPQPWSEISEAVKDAYNRTYDRLPKITNVSPKGSIWNIIEGNWIQFKGLIKEKWNQVTDDEIEEMQGRRERIIGQIHKTYGRDRWSEDDIEKELSSLDRSTR